MTTTASLGSRPVWRQQRLGRQRGKQAKKVLRLTLPHRDAPWFNDDDLLLFFHKEHIQHPEGQRLSDGVGKGLW